MFTELQKITEEGCVQEVTAKSKVANPLSVAGNTQNKRLVLDARHVNPHLFRYELKYEEASTDGENCFKKLITFVSFDLISAYRHNY